MNPRRLAREGSLAVFLPLFAALFFRALIPVGFMPTFDEQSKFSIMLCSTEARSAAAAGDPTSALQDESAASDHGADSNVDNHSPCVFAASGLAALLPAVDQQIAAAAPPSIALALLFSQIPTRVLPRAHAPRGPPA